ncbi:MAG: hypothetical protein SF172_17235 [Burkholderiales bacterium]|nr:hypothetical protein [Burkholderiales bacterium]
MPSQRPATAARRILVLTAAVTILFGSLPSVAQSAADLQRCRDLKDAAARLACYDAIPLAPTSAAVPPATRATATVAPAQAISTTPVAADFGLERRAEQKREEVKTIESRITGNVEGWEPNSRFTLDNGQVWQVSDDSRSFGNVTNPKVKISRGTFGTFFLEIEGINAAPRVKRIR